MNESPHLPWFIRERPLDDGQAVIENGAYEGDHIAVCEWHIARYIVNCVNNPKRDAQIAAITRKLEVAKGALEMARPFVELSYDETDRHEAADAKLVLDRIDEAIKETDQ